MGWTVMTRLARRSLFISFINLNSIELKAVTPVDLVLSHDVIKSVPKELNPSTSSVGILGPRTLFPEKV